MKFIFGKLRMYINESIPTETKLQYYWTVIKQNACGHNK